MKIQFIVVGWHYSYDDLIDGLIELKNDNDMVNVFWSCHKEPTDVIKENFDWKLFDNLGLEDGAYQQALDYLKPDDDVILGMPIDEDLQAMSRQKLCRYMDAVLPEKGFFDIQSTSKIRLGCQLLREYKQLKKLNK